MTRKYHDRNQLTEFFNNAYEGSKMLTAMQSILSSAVGRHVSLSDLAFACDSDIKLPHSKRFHVGQIRKYLSAPQQEGFVKYIYRAVKHSNERVGVYHTSHD